MNILFIDTRNNSKIIVRLETAKGTYEEESAANKSKAQMTLPLIRKVLKRAKIENSGIDEIKIEKGPGSFTGLRVGISIANALALGLLVKINGRRLGEIENPEYQIKSKF